MTYEQWWLEFIAEHEDWKYADSDALRRAAFNGGQESLRQQLADSQKCEVMLRVALERLVTERRAGLASLEGWDAAREALAATADLKDMILCHAEPCRDDGRCQYAIDHGAEGLGHCPEEKCCMPLYRAGEPKTRKVKMECFLIDGELHWRDENQSVLRHWKRFPAGDLEGEVCGSIHEAFAKKKDALYSTRHSDFERHAEDARRMLSTESKEKVE